MAPVNPTSCIFSFVNPRFPGFFFVSCQLSVFFPLHHLSPLVFKDEQNLKSFKLLKLIKAEFKA